MARSEQFVALATHFLAELVPHSKTDEYLQALHDAYDPSIPKASWW